MRTTLRKPIEASGDRPGRTRLAPAAVTAGCFALALAAGLFAGAPSYAASIPAWLDDSITIFNERNPETRISFVDIKDSFVWYRIPNAPDIGSHDIRERVYTTVAENGYKRSDEDAGAGRPRARVDLG